MNSWAGYPQAPRKNNMHCNMAFRAGLRSAARCRPLDRVFGTVAFPEAELPRAGQCFGVLPLQKINELLAHLATQVEGLAGRTRAQQAAQLHGAFLEIGDLQAGGGAVPFVRLLEDFG